MNEVELLESAKKGNKSSLNTLLNNNYPVLKGYVIKMTGDIHLSQDIIQDTMLKAVLSIKKFQPKAKFSTYLIKIATNVFRDYLRKNKVYELLDESLPDNSHSVEDLAIVNFEYKEILNILLKLPYEKRSVFILKHYHGFKYEEIGDILNCPIGTVRSRLHYTTKFIISELEKKEMI